MGRCMTTNMDSSPYAVRYKSKQQRVGRRDYVHYPLCVINHNTACTSVTHHPDVCTTDAPGYSECIMFCSLCSINVHGMSATYYGCYNFEQLDYP